MSEVMPAAPPDLQQNTYNTLIPYWMNNFAENLSLIRSGKDVVDLPKHTGEPMLLIGGGPSLKTLNHLDLIAKSKWKHPIIVCDKELANCLRKRVKPSLVVTLDGSPKVATFYNQPVVRKLGKDVTPVFVVTTHPSVVKIWSQMRVFDWKLLDREGPNIHWFVGMLDELQTSGTKCARCREETQFAFNYCPFCGKHLADNRISEQPKLNTRSVTYIIYLLSGRKGTMSGIGNVGSCIWNIGAALGASPLILVGYDFSEQVKYKSQAVYWNAFLRMYLTKYKNKKKALDAAAALHQVEENPDFHTKYLVNPIWKQYRDLLKAHIVSSKIPTINATGNGCLTTEAIKCENFTAKPLEEILNIYK